MLKSNGAEIHDHTTRSLKREYTLYDAQNENAAVQPKIRWHDKVKEKAKQWKRPNVRSVPDMSMNVINTFYSICAHITFTLLKFIRYFGFR